MSEEYNPNISILAKLIPAILGVISAGALCIIIWICAKQLRARNKKQNHYDASYPIQTTRRPTAVRSPNGQPPYYLKKSPSPNNHKLGMSMLQAVVDQNNTTSAVTTQTIKYMEANELTLKSNKNNGNDKNASLDGCLVNNNLTSCLTGKMKKNIITESINLNSKDNNINTNTNSNTNPNTLNFEQFGKLGTIFFKLRYLAERNALIVSIIRCRGLPCKTNNSTHIKNSSDISNTDMISNGINGRSQAATDPYVKLQLLPDKQHKVKTRVVRNTCNPVYDEDFTFYGLNINDLSNMLLHFVILSFDRYSRDDIIGEVLCPLTAIEIGDICKEALSISKEIQPRNLKIRTQGRGELLISLCWQPAACRLTVVLLKARNLPRMDVTGLADPYVKIYLQFNGQRIAKKKTHVKKRTLNPVFNESFAFDIPSIEGVGATLDDVSLELILLDWDRVTKNEVIGRLELGGLNSNGSTLNHWNEVCNSPRRQIAEWHKLNE